MVVRSRISDADYKSGNVVYSPKVFVDNNRCFRTYIVYPGSTICSYQYNLQSSRATPRAKTPMAYLVAEGVLGPGVSAGSLPGPGEVAGACRGGAGDQQWEHGEHWWQPGWYS